MPFANFRVLQGADRGRAYLDLKLPMTIGREEGNAIQLNDERISRYHVKIQEDNQHVILTDLESTNGTRVNGMDCQLRILRPGDVIAVGRSVLLYGNRDDIASTSGENLTASEGLDEKRSNGDFIVSNYLEVAEHRARARPSPGLPDRLTPSQAAQLSELLEFFHAEIGSMVEQAKIPEKANTIQLDQLTWRHLLKVYGRLSELIRKVGEPDA
jgi:pSer/pThr/pTyr-binding forkhead associated (FHA) protein